VRRLLLLAILAGCDPEPVPMGDMSMPPDQSNAPCTNATAGTCVLDVSGTIVDELGQPLQMILVSVCADACYFGRSGTDGRFTAELKDKIAVDQFALLLHGRPDRASYYTKLPAPVSDHIAFAKPLVLPKIPDTGPAIKTDKSAQTVTAGDVTLIIAAGTDVQLDVEDFADLPRGGQLRPLRLMNPSSWPFVDAANVPDLLYALSPFEVLFVPKAKLSFANVASWPQGTAVDVLAQRSLIGGTPPAGPLERVAGAHVSASNTIDLDSGEGIGGMTLIGLKRK
jgi:hypothetical protein